MAKLHLKVELNIAGQIEDHDIVVAIGAMIQHINTANGGKAVVISRHATVDSELTIGGVPIRQSETTGNLRGADNERAYRLGINSPRF